MGEPPTIVLKAVPEAIKEARDFVGMVLGAWGLESYVARTVICELATNAIKHGSMEDGVIVVRAYLRDGRPVVEAWDLSDDPPVVRDAGELDESGRGLLLVTRMVTRWGTRPLASGGKIVWAELATVPG
ncbi:ATP-binding protein [Spirillospora sp. NPDC029432]|uniref:ATP-binding protein n=1 Tax=Spirillospora sp. NPDC029432 TaxID=3154599 RepID=UPI003453D43A